MAVEENLLGQPEFGKGAGLEWVKDTYGSTATVSEKTVGDPEGSPGGWSLSWPSSFQASPTVPGAGMAAGDTLLATGWATEGCSIFLQLGDGDDLPYGGEELGSVDAEGDFSLEVTVPETFTAGPTNGPRLMITYTRTVGPSDCTVQALSVGVKAEVVDPPPGTGPDTPWTDLAAKTAQFLGRGDDEMLIAQATIHSEIVAGYVAGYTRGRGFDDDGEPNRQLRFVIVAATARLSANPEQVSYYQAADYSEKPAVLAGWTLPELAVLHNYRRRSA